MFGIGVPELVVILVVALIFLGPTRLPEVAKALGRALGEFRKATSDISEELRDVRRTLEKEVRDAERDSARRKMKESVARQAAPPAETEKEESEASGS
jgi:TatA/E family protein of Tat protein translocase